MKKTNILYNKLNYEILSETTNNLSDFQISVLIGLMLGDASLYRTSSTSNTRLEFSFGEKYKLFAEKIEIIFNLFISTPLKSVEIKGKLNTYLNYRLKTRSFSIFNKYYELFYKEKILNNGKSKFIKIVPNHISEYMNPIVLAYLIMSDGNFYKSRNRIRIYTNSFTKQEVEILAESIKNKLGIYVGVLHDRKDQWIITIGAKQLELLRKLVLPYFEKSMLYRIGLD
jgi:LAGLIDADG DNA endonuclease family